MDTVSLGKQADGAQMVHFRCPGCEGVHQIRVGTWTWNGDLESPTFSPSVLVNGFGYPHGIDPAPGETQRPRPTVCHSFVTDGRIQFLGDCTHSLAGQTVDLPPWREVC